MSDKTIHILMIRARRTGKSSVLSSMINRFKDIAKDTNFHLTADKNTSAILDTKLIDLRDVFDENWGQESFPIDETPTPHLDDYVFHVTYRDKEKEHEVAELVFHDIAGEDIGSTETKDLVKKAGILLVAVDTVHLMEEDGKFFSVFHKPMILKNTVATGGFAAEENGEENKDPNPKMVLFVPLKCEKYYAEHRMDEVARRVEAEFQILIDYLNKPSFQNRITMAITPILTMGSIGFDHFGRDEKGKVIRQKIEGKQDHLRPAKVYYKFIGDKTFRPQYCEQPVLYILSFITNSAKSVREIAKKKKKRNIFLDIIKFVTLLYLFGWIYLGIWLLEKKTAYTKDYGKISLNLKKMGDGYKMLQNPLNL